MSGRIINSGPFLRASRDFPEDSQAMRMELIKMYNDVSNNTNARTIGNFATGGSSVNGESWFFTGTRQQGLRQVYAFTTFASITHNLQINNIGRFVRIFGAFTDGSVWYPLPYVSSTAANQVGVKVTSTQIVFDAGGTAPTPTNGQVVLEWIGNV